MREHGAADADARWGAAGAGGLATTDAEGVYVAATTEAAVDVVTTLMTLIAGLLSWFALDARGGRVAERRRGVKGVEGDGIRAGWTNVTCRPGVCTAPTSRAPPYDVRSQSIDKETRWRRSPDGSIR